MMEQQPAEVAVRNPAEIKMAGLKFGILAGLVEAGLMYGSYYAGMDTFITVQVVSRFIPYTILILLFAGISLRKKRGGYLTLKEALQFAFLAYVISELIVGAGTYLLYNVIDKDLTAKSIEIGAQRTRTMMEKISAPEADINDAVAKIRGSKERTGMKQIFLGLGYSLIFDFVKSMLIAFVIKKEKKTL
jgi:hypothetical protein